MRRLALLALLGCGGSAPPPEAPPPVSRIPLDQLTPATEPYSRALRPGAVAALRLVERTPDEIVLDVVFPPQGLREVERPEDVGPMSVRRVYHDGLWTLSAGGRAMPLRALDEGFRFERACAGEAGWFRPVSRLRVGVRALPWPEAAPGAWVGFAVAEAPEGPALELPDLVLPDQAPGGVLSASLDLDAAPEVGVFVSGCGEVLRGPSGEQPLSCCAAPAEGSQADAAQADAAQAEASQVP